MVQYSKGLLLTAAMFQVATLRALDLAWLAIAVEAGAETLATVLLVHVPMEGLEGLRRFTLFVEKSDLMM